MNINVGVSLFTKHQLRIFVALLMIYPVITFVQRLDVFGVPFDSETTQRFVIPFAFENSANLSWTLSESIQHGFTRPVYSLTFLLDYLLWKTDHRFYHVTDFFLSWATFAMLLLLFRKRFGLPVAALAVVLWALHPAQAYSMMLFIGRNDRLVVLFVLAVLTLYDRAADSKSISSGRKFLLGSLVFAIIGYFAKETCLPYLAIAFGWGWLVLQIKPLSTFRNGLLLWIGGGAAFAVLMLTKPLLNLGLPAEFGFGSAYLLKFGLLVAWSLPFSIDPSVFLGVISISFLAVLVLLRRIPGSVRFGAYLALIAYAPFPLFWVQKTFLWLPTVGLCLIISGTIAAIYQNVSNRIARISIISTAVLLLLSTAFWGKLETDRIIAFPIAFKVAARYLVETENGPVYNGDDALDAVPAIGSAVVENPDEPVITHKSRDYLEQLVQLMVMNPDARIEWHD